MTKVVRPPEIVHVQVRRVGSSLCAHGIPNVFVGAQRAVAPIDCPVGRLSFRIRLKHRETTRSKPVGPFPKICDDPCGDGPVNRSADTSRIVDIRNMHGLPQDVCHDGQEERIALRQSTGQHNPLDGDSPITKAIDDGPRAEAKAVHERPIDVDSSC